MSKQPVNVKENATLWDKGLKLRVYLDPEGNAWWRSPVSGMWYDIQVTSEDRVEKDQVPKRD